MEHIPADKLIAEVERLKPRLRKIGGKDVLVTTDSVYKKLNHIIDFARSLQKEQPEVDFEKELKQFRHKHFKGERDGDYSGEYFKRESQLDIARHFYELGKNARKEE